MMRNKNAFLLDIWNENINYWEALKSYFLNMLIQFTIEFYGFFCMVSHREWYFLPQVLLYSIHLRDFRNQLKCHLDPTSEITIQYQLIPGNILSLVLWWIKVSPENITFVWREQNFIKSFLRYGNKICHRIDFFGFHKWN